MPEILLIDDDYVARYAATRTLESRGFQVETAANGLDALSLLYQRKADGRLPCLVVLDLMMPVNGWVFLGELRADPILRDVPVALVTGIAEADLPPEHPRIDAYLRKPVDTDRLVELARRYCRGGQAVPAGAA